MNHRCPGPAPAGSPVRRDSDATVPSVAASIVAVAPAVDPRTPHPPDESTVPSTAQSLVRASAAASTTSCCTGVPDRPADHVAFHKAASFG